MKYNEFTKGTKVKALEKGNHEVIFNKISYWVDKNTDDVRGAFVKVKGFKDIFIPITDNNTTQIDYLLEQLNIDTYDPEIINQCVGITIHVTLKERITDRGTFLNADFNPNAKEDNITTYSGNAFANA